jgi:aminoglycoside 6'-N-acetyltransferase I
MHIRLCTPDDLADWARLRTALWPEEDASTHAEEANAVLGDGDALALLCRDDSQQPLGFAEAALRRDYVNGCETSPVAFLEGVYVVPTARGRGVGRALVAQVAQWGRSHGCSEFASDALLDNGDSHRFHRALGFEETERVVYFRRPI